MIPTINFTFIFNIIVDFQLPRTDWCSWPSAGEYFPRAYIDTISVWEDESIAFDVLANDYFAGNNASVVEFSKVHYKVKVFF